VLLDEVPLARDALGEGDVGDAGGFSDEVAGGGLGFAGVDVGGEGVGWSGRGAYVEEVFVLAEEVEAYVPHVTGDVFLTNVILGYQIIPFAIQYRTTT